MTDKPEDYAQPKHRATQAEALRAVEAAADEAMKQRNENALPSENRNVSDYAALGSQAITRYFEAAAVHMEQAAAEIMKEAEHARDELMMQAEDVRHTAKALTAAVEAAASRTKRAAIGATDLRKAFADDVARERAEHEAARQRAAG
jgi:hypothetical protein